MNLDFFLSIVYGYGYGYYFYLGSDMDFEKSDPNPI